jgi:hypothetical protein
MGEEIQSQQVCITLLNVYPDVTTQGQLSLIGVYFNGLWQGRIQDFKLEVLNIRDWSEPYTYSTSYWAAI